MSLALAKAAAKGAAKGDGWQTLFEFLEPLFERLMARFNLAWAKKLPKRFFYGKRCEKTGILSVSKSRRENY